VTPEATAGPLFHRTALETIRKVRAPQRRERRRCRSRPKSRPWRSSGSYLNAGRILPPWATTATTT